MKRNVLKNLVLVMVTVGLLISCATTPPMPESLKLFQQEAEVSILSPMRFYTWVKVEYSKRVQNDIMNNLLDFKYEESSNFLLKTIKQENNILSVWGNQLVLQEREYRTLVFTPFIMAIYALENEQDPIDIAFESLKQILADASYEKYEEKLIPVFQYGIIKYRIGGDAWEKYKSEHFVIENKTITIK